MEKIKLSENLELSQVVMGWKNRPDFSCKPESILCRNKWICFVGYAIDSQYGSNYGKGFF